jgi:D-aminopeptidase
VQEKRVRAREAGIVVGYLLPGPNNAITDIEGVSVGHSTIIRGEGPLVVGEGPVRTGVTVVCPRKGLTRDEPAFAGSHRLNGNGEMTGLEWIREAGVLTTPVAITNTHSVGVVRDALITAELEERTDEDIYWCMPVVAETFL